MEDLQENFEKRKGETEREFAQKEKELDKRKEGGRFISNFGFGAIRGKEKTALEDSEE